MHMKTDTVSMPVSTLNCIKQLLFKEGGVDVAPLIKDLTLGEDNEDLVAINVALVLKGVKPEVDTQTRYRTGYQCFYREDFVSYSLIHDKVTTRTTRLVTTEHGDAKVDRDLDRSVYSLSEWLAMEINPDKVMPR